MASVDDAPQFDLDVRGPVAVVKVLARQIRHPYEAQKFGEELEGALTRGGHARALIDFSKNDYLCSTGFAVLFNLAKTLKERGGELKLCRLDPNVLTGARIIGLGKSVDIFDDADEALKSF